MKSLRPNKFPGHPQTVGDISALISYPPDLPIIEKREEIIQAISNNQVLIITGETGSGKSTQLPKMCIEAGRGAKGFIGCTQPRRIAAITLANRVSEELKGVGSAWVGYKIRFQDRTARSTRIKFMTDGILLAEAQKDRLFGAYDTLIIDEAHERSINIDFILGLIKKILPRRPDLKVIVTSATLDPEKFSQAFDQAPILEVSGRTYPVEVWHRPPETPQEEDDASYIDQAVAAVDLLKAGHEVGNRGDILIFMPTESDIRETVQRLEDKHYLRTIVLPLFGRMATTDQQRIFQLTSEEKIVVATNVAETSITIPRIRYVIDSGFARIAQYNPRSRTRSLPIVPISQASADQRRGRCGRVEAGVCVRLYSKEDYLARPLFTPPEILRSNLAEVILRMLFLRLGSIQDFPFLDPPSPAAIKDAFGILKELGAIDEHRRLTSTGSLMARLPLDPRLARMLIEARNQRALIELVILASVLSIQDPRERPLDQEQQADQAHARFRDARSDFVTLLRIWQAFHQKENSKEVREAQPGTIEPSVHNSDSQLPTRSQMRKFCRDHFLSYRRMREWRDIHDEVWSMLEELEGFERNSTPASYEAIHRALLSGYLSHIARKKEKNLYLGSKNRQLMLFPGSALFNRGGAWTMAAEQVQTSRLYARTVAAVEPEWIEELGRHLCRSVYFEPHWEKARGQVVAYERVILYGLTLVDRRKVDYSRVNPHEAREIFIRSALVAGELSGRYVFLDHNRKLIARIEDLENKTRRRDLLVDEEAIFRFYDQRVPNIADAASLRKCFKEWSGDHFLRMTEADLLETSPGLEIQEQFPNSLPVGDLELPLRYVFHPGAEDDGVTVTVPMHVLPTLSAARFEWLVPGLLPEKILLLLKALPKSLRRHLVPVVTTAEGLMQFLAGREGSLEVQLSRGIDDLTGIQVPVSCWDQKSLPLHLQMRFEVTGPEGNLLGSGRNLIELRSLAGHRLDDGLWEQARKTWEKEGLTAWDFGELPRCIELGKDALGLTVNAYPGLVAEGQTAALRLFGSPDAAREASVNGLLLLYQWVFAAELKQPRRDWVFPHDLAAKVFFMGNRQEAMHSLQLYILREIFDLRAPQWPDYRHFLAARERLQGRIGLLSQEMLNEVFDAIRERHASSACLQRLVRLSGKNQAFPRQLNIILRELDELVPADFLVTYGREQIRQLPRYLKALKIRAERAYAAPEKDRLKAEQVASFRERYEQLKQEVMMQPNAERLCFLDELRWMLEELKLSLFAPEIKARLRISPKRLEEKFAEWQSLKDRD
jgi:ATP-dependent helicase HrpA